MDPATAISTASAILSFIEFAWEVVLGARDIYKSADGASKENRRILDTVANIQGLTEHLGTRTLGNSKPENDMERLASDCNTLSKDLIATLRKLQSTGSMFSAVKAKLKTTRKKDEISSIRERLAEYTYQMKMLLSTILL